MFTVRCLEVRTRRERSLRHCLSLQLRQRSAYGLASSRRGSMASPQRAQIPYNPWSMRPSARSIAAISAVADSPMRATTSSFCRSTACSAKSGFRGPEARRACRCALSRRAASSARLTSSLHRNCFRSSTRGSASSRRARALTDLTRWAKRCLGTGFVSIGSGALGGHREGAQ